MLSFQRKLHVFKKKDATSNVACTKVTEYQHFCVNFKHALGFCDCPSWANCEVREKTNKMQQLDVYF